VLRRMRVRSGARRRRSRRVVHVARTVDRRVERRQVRSASLGPERGDVGERGAVRGSAARTGSVWREGRRCVVAEHRRRMVRRGRVVGPAAEEGTPGGVGRRWRRGARIESARSAESVRRGSQQAAAGVHHRQLATTPTV